MIKFCPECGVKLEKEFKFCPECGFGLENVKSEKASDNNIVNPIVCENCGEENRPENIICAGCGMKIQNGPATVNKRKPVQKKHSGKPSKSNQNKKSKRQPEKPEQVQVHEKSLSRNTLVGIVFGGIVAIVLILFATGEFDSVNVPVTNPGNTQTQGSGVDLGNLQRINELEAKVKANPNDQQSLLALAHLKNDSGLYEQAIVDYRKYLKLNPKNADARIDMGVCYYSLGDNKTAIAEMEQALKYNPHHQIGFLNLGVVNLSAGNIAKSDEWLKKAIQENPNNDIAKRARELLENHGK